jgi:hypothetical protein
MATPRGRIGYTNIGFSADNTGPTTRPIFNCFPHLVHKPLNEAAREIRVLRIHPSSSSDALISVELVHIRRDAALYDCLSYTWGNASKRKPILVNGQRFDATENLVEALIHLRNVDIISPKALFGRVPKRDHQYRRNEYIWIDIVCVNQKDRIEKESQVRQMHDIYARAAQVNIWLGSASDNSKLAFDTIVRSADRYWELEKTLAGPSGPSSASGGSHTRTVAQIQHDRGLAFANEFLPNKDYAKLESLQHLFSRPWWSRVWIVQEAANAENAWFICGSDNIHFEDVRVLGITIVETIQNRTLIETAWNWSPFAVGLTNILPSTMPITFTWMKKKRTLLSAMQRLFLGRETGATDPRDRIYALLGLNTDVDAKELGLTVDYSITWQKLYEFVTRSMIKHQGLSVLTLCTPLGRRLEDNLPSWVPDWTSQIPSPLSGMKAGALYSAGGIAIHSEPSGGTGNLTLSGVYIARIRSFGDRPPLQSEGSTSEEDVAWDSQWIQNLTNLVSSSGVPLRLREDSVIQVASAGRLCTGPGKLIRIPKNDLPTYQAIQEYFYFVQKPPSRRSQSAFYAMPKDAHYYRTALSVAANCRKPFLSDTGRVGLAPDLAAPGDVIGVFYGTDAPFVLRPVREGTFRLIGEAYVCGIMDSEALNGKFTETSFTLQ